VSNALVPAGESRALTTAKDRTEGIRKALIERLPNILPNGMSPQRFEAVTIQAIAKNPDLLDCTPASVVMAVLEAAQLGLEPTGSLSRAWLIPFKGEATLMIGYQGLVDLARRSGDVSKVWARVVYEGDDFAVTYGSNEGIHHIPLLETTDPTKITHFYAIAKLKDGSQVFEVMTKQQVDAIRARSRSANRGPWVTDYAEMGKKTTTRRLVKSLPLTAEIMDAVARDDEREFAGQPEAPAESRTSTVKAALAAKLRPSEAPPVQNAPGAAEEAPAQSASTDSAGGQTDPIPVADAREICGAGSDPALGKVTYCVLAPGHAFPNGKPTPHEDDEGSKFPNAVKS
jgi:recombination protein RecT